jgi:hypothetical protein
VRRSIVGQRIAVVVFGVAAFAFGVASDTEARPAGSWSLPAGLPGRAVSPNHVTRTAARLGGIDLATLREVVAVTNRRGDRFAIVAASNSAGKTCFSFGTRAFANSFRCLDELPERVAVRNYLSAGGGAPDAVDYVIVAGLARSDVARIVLTLAGGSERELDLNAWRAYAYTASAPGSMPTKLTAYRGDGTIVQEDAVAVEPLCSAPACLEKR